MAGISKHARSPRRSGKAWSHPCPGDATVKQKQHIWHLRVELQWQWWRIEASQPWSERAMRGWVDFYREHGFHKPKRTTAVRMHKVPISLQAEMVRILTRDPESYYEEVQDLIAIRTNTHVPLSTVSRLMRDAGFKSKVSSSASAKRSKYTMQRHAALRDFFLDRQLLFIDECHRRGRDLVRNRVKARVGQEQFVDNTVVGLGTAWTMLAAMDVTGIVAVKIIELSRTHANGMPSALTRVQWLDLFEAHILPFLNPCDCRQLRRSVVVADNCSLHWGNDEDDAEFINQLDALVRSKGAVLVYTPPYCPRANAVESIFKEMTDYCRRHREATKRDPPAAMTAGLLAVTPEKAATFVRKSGEKVARWLDFAV
jgi:hypothetical protein